MMTRYDEVVAQVGSRFDDECWYFPSNGGGGYAMLWHEGRMLKVANLAYRLRYGEPPQGTEFDHKCQDRGCWNPDHIEPVAHSENIRRSGKQDTNSHKTHCPQGHPYDVENTRWKQTNHPYGSGWQRVCKACGREYIRQRRKETSHVNVY